VVVSAAALSIPDLGAFEQRGSTYPEWDSHNGRYKPEWCTVIESDPDSPALESFVAPDAHVLHRPLARLGTDLDRQHRQLQGIDIDIDATVDARVELMAGAAPSEAVYIDSVRRRRDLSVLLLLDVSGSANEPSVTGRPVHEHQRAAAAALTAALHALGDRVALYGFRSQGRTAVHVVPVKRFADALDARVMRRLGGLVPGAYTRLGAAIRHGATVLERDAGTSRRLLIVLSDGFAYDHGYERSYGEADARRALSESRRRGIGSLCLSVGARTDIGALQRVFGTSAHAAVARVDDLPPIVGPLFRSALDSADRQRRISQRTIRTKERLRIERRTA
jgi:nitric oxide reductase activation protein